MAPRPLLAQTRPARAHSLIAFPVQPSKRSEQRFYLFGFLHEIRLHKLLGYACVAHGILCNLIFEVFKQSTTVRIDADVLAWLKAQGQGIRRGLTLFCGQQWSARWVKRYAGGEGRPA